MARHGENIYKRKDGRWEGRYKNGCRDNGEAKYSSVYGKSYSEVRAQLIRKRSEVQNNAVHCRATFGELADIWMKGVKNTVKESTYINYYIKLNKHILPFLGNIKYENLTLNTFNEFISQKRSEELSSKYISDIVNVIKSITKFARRTFNYVDKAEFLVVPREKKYKDNYILDADQQKTLVKYLTENRSNSNVGILMSLLMGIRLGELCALKWSDIDLDKRILTVDQTIQRIKDLNEENGTKILIGAPKSETSARDIPIPDLLIDILNDLKSDDDNYFLTGRKNFTEPRTMQYRFKSILKRLSLPDYSFHSLRHTFATNCIAIGFDVKTLSEILGHSSVELTLNRYVHSSFERKRDCMQLLNNRFI